MYKNIALEVGEDGAIYQKKMEVNTSPLSAGKGY